MQIPSSAPFHLLLTSAIAKPCSSPPLQCFSTHWFSGLKLRVADLLCHHHFPPAPSPYASHTPVVAPVPFSLGPKGADTFCPFLHQWLWQDNCTVSALGSGPATHQGLLPTRMDLLSMVQPRGRPLSSLPGYQIEHLSSSALPLK